MKKYVHAFTAGVTIGLIISLIVQAVIGVETYYPTSPTTVVGQWLGTYPITAAIAYSLVLWGLIGVISCWFATLYHNENRSLLMNTCLHLVGQFILILGAGLACGWFDWSWRMFFVFLGEFILVYAIIWWGSYLRVRWEIKQINEQLAER